MNNYASIIITILLLFDTSFGSSELQSCLYNDIMRIPKNTITFCLEEKDKETLNKKRSSKIIFRDFSFVRWINENEIMIVENGENNVERVLIYNVIDKNFSFIYNEKFTDKVGCVFSSDGKYIVIEYYDQDRIRVLHKGEVIYEKNDFVKFALKGRVAELKKAGLTPSINSKKILYIDNSHIILSYHDFPMPPNNELFLVDINYKKDQVKRIISAGDDTYHFQFYVNSDNQIISQGISYIAYYSVDESRLIRRNLKPKMSLDKVKILGDSIYCAGRYPEDNKYSLFVFHDKIKPRKLFHNITTFLLSDKYILLLYRDTDLEWKEIKLYRKDNFKEIKPFELNGNKQSITIYDTILFSQSSNKLAIFKSRKNIVQIIDLSIYNKEQKGGAKKGIE